jgi:nucleoid DNA-binding protein
VWETVTVTKKEIVKAISEEIGLPQLKTKEIVQKTFDAIVDTLVRESRIELRNFGVFEVKRRAARKARNPRTGERVDVAEKFVVTFKPGKEMEERVRQLEEEERRKAEAIERGEDVPETDTQTDRAAGPANSPPAAGSGGYGDATEAHRRGSSEATGAGSQPARGDREPGSHYDPS